MRSNRRLATAALLAVLAAAAPFAAGAAEGLYARAEIGAFSLDLPASTPFIETDSRERLAGFLPRSGASRRTSPMLRAAIGGRMAAFGRGAWVEARGFASTRRASFSAGYAGTSDLWDSLEARHIGVAEAELRGWSAAEREARRGEILADPARRQALIDAIGAENRLRFAGWIGAIDGAPLEYAPNFLWGDEMRLRSSEKAAYWGGGPIIGVPLRSGADGELSVFAGADFRVLDRRLDTSAWEATNRRPDENFLTLDERLRASWLGVITGARAALPVAERWSLSASGEAGLFRLASEYRGRQRTVLSPPADIDLRTALDLRDTRAAAALRAEAALEAGPFSGVVLRLGGGLEFLSHVPRVRYARPGDRFSDGAPHDPARLDWTSALGWFGALSVRVAF